MLRGEFARPCGELVVVDSMAAESVDLVASFVLFRRAVSGDPFTLDPHFSRNRKERVGGRGEFRRADNTVGAEQPMTVAMVKTERIRLLCERERDHFVFILFEEDAFAEDKPLLFPQWLIGSGLRFIGLTSLDFDIRAEELE